MMRSASVRWNGRVASPSSPVWCPEAQTLPIFYYPDMSEFRALLEKVSGEGRYCSQSDSQGNMPYNGKPANGR